jgi:TonB family protein
MSLIVGADGRAHKVQLLKGLGLGLDESAIRALQLWRFEPARQMDKEVAVGSRIEMHFDIM